jgi:hypothetical protein
MSLARLCGNSKPYRVGWFTVTVKLFIEIIETFKAKSKQGPVPVGV